MKKTVFITGATSGIGESCAVVFANHGYNLILTGRRADRLESLKKSLTNNKAIHIQTLCFDVKNLTQTKASIASIDQTKFPSIDILINNAGLASGMSTIDEGEYEDWDTMIDTNVKGLLYVSREMLPIFKRQGFGHIINIGSVAGRDVYAKGNVYCATKHAVDAISKSMRIDLLPYGIKVTCINPGAVETEFSLVRFKGDEEKAKAMYKGYTPLSAQDIADTIYYASTLPKHVCINDITLTCLTQANGHYNIKNN